MKLITITLVFISHLILVACNESSKDVTTDQNQYHETKQQLMYSNEFNTWKKAQNQEKLKQYEAFFTMKLKKAPTLYELTVNSHPLNQDCAQFRFSLPPEEQWKNLLAALQMLEKLNESKLFENYKIVSVYRSPQANECVKSAKGSKHLGNYAVDFQTLDDNHKRYLNDAEMDQKLCRFWREEGREHRLGLGLYGKQRYHIDTQGYRTWGVGYKSSTSPCLKAY